MSKEDTKGKKTENQTEAAAIEGPVTAPPVVITAESADTAQPREGSARAQKHSKNTISDKTQAPFAGAEAAIDEMPAERAAEKANAREVLEKVETDREKPPAPKKDGLFSEDFTRRVWAPWLKPLVVLTCICLVTSLLLGLTNAITTPYIEANAAALANAARQELLPQASGFEDITPAAPPSGLTSVYRATNDAGYIIVAFGKGYDGNVPAMVAINDEGLVAGVKFLENNETPGLGQRLVTDPTFAAQFTGRPANEEVDTGDIDALAGATMSTSAGVSAVNIALEYYFIELGGGTLHYDMPDEAMQHLLPGASSWQELEVESQGIAGAYLGSDGTYVLVAQAKGVRTITVAVAVGDDGVIQQIWMDTSGESEGYGRELAADYSYTGQFIGQSGTQDVDTIAGVTISTQAINEAVDLALAALPLAKEAA